MRHFPLRGRIRALLLAVPIAVVAVVGFWPGAANAEGTLDPSSATTTVQSTVDTTTSTVTDTTTTTTETVTNTVDSTRGTVDQTVDTGAATQTVSDTTASVPGGSVETSTTTGSTSGTTSSLPGSTGTSTQPADTTPADTTQTSSSGDQPSSNGSSTNDSSSSSTRTAPSSTTPTAAVRDRAVGSQRGSHNVAYTVGSRVASTDPLAPSKHDKKNIHKVIGSGNKLGSGQPTVLGTHIQNTAAQKQAATEAETSGAGSLNGTLAFTGFSVLVALVLSMSLMASGEALVLTSWAGGRKRRVVRQAVLFQRPERMAAFV
ncbi:MAG: hypothetical protein ABR579_11630 [Actinomycetota bacterium]